MTKILIADNDITYAINLMNFINSKYKNIKVSNIITNENEIQEIVSHKNDIDVILLDYSILNNDKEKSLIHILNNNINDNLIIILSQTTKCKINSDKKFIYNFDYKNKTMSSIVKKINELTIIEERKDINKELKNKILNELLYIGYDISHKGTKYLVDSIEYIYNNPDSIDNLERNVYPNIALKYNTDIHNIKCRIINETTTMYCNCEIEKLKKYFQFYIDTKPKVKTIINTVIRKVS